MQTSKDNTSKSRSDGMSSVPNENDNTKSNSAVASDDEPKKSSSNDNKGPRRHSTRRVKAPKPFFPPMEGIKGVSATAKKTTHNSSSDKKRGNVPFASSYENRGRFVRVLYDMIEDTHNEDQELMSWSRDGKSFIINPDHEGLESKLQEYFTHGKLRSLQRQLYAYGFLTEGWTFSHPLFRRGMNEVEMIAIPRKSRNELDAEDAQNEKKHKVSFDGANNTSNKSSRSFSDGNSKANDGDDWSHDSQPSFPQTIHNMLEEVKDPTIMKWTAGGKAFVVDPHHPGLGEVLEKYFQHKRYLSFHRQLNQYNWTKPTTGDYQGMLFNPAFYRNMPEKNFDLIRRKDSGNYIPLAQQLKLAEKYEKEIEKRRNQDINSKKKGDKIILVPAAARIAAKSTGSSVAAVATAKNDKKSKGASTSNQPSEPNKTQQKKRKEPPASSSGVERPSKAKKLSIEAQKAQTRLVQYKRLHGLFDAWTPFNLPPSLKSPIKKLAKTPVGYSPNGKEGIDAIQSNAKFLICKEEMPDWLAQDEKENLKELEEMIIRDRRQRQTRQDAWSRKYSVAKGKTLPRSKFNRPTNRWKKVSPGDRIDVYWYDDNMYYTAHVIKHQPGTTYFHLFYEVDGAMEWLDLSREDFKLVESQKSELGGLSSSSLNALASGRSLRVKSTPKKDNRSGRREPVVLPENHAHLAPYLRYSWCNLGLGEDLGTPAYNEFIKKGDANATLVTPLEVLHGVRALRARGFSPKSEEDLRDRDDPVIANNKVVASLRDLQDEISQDFGASSRTHIEETFERIRKVTDHWTIPALIENMQRMETRIATLDEREARVLEKLRRKKLI